MHAGNCGGNIERPMSGSPARNIKRSLALLQVPVKCIRIISAPIAHAQPIRTVALTTLGSTARSRTRTGWALTPIPTAEGASINSITPLIGGPAAARAIDQVLVIGSRSTASAGSYGVGPLLRNGTRAPIRVPLPTISFRLVDLHKHS
jgi:hypothetical protein